MQHYMTLDGVLIPDAWVTIGSFDGVHLGHQAIVRKIVSGAHRAGLPAVVLTFFPHPAVVLKKRIEPFYLTTPEERAALLGDMGVDVVVTHPFDASVASMSALDFMTRLKTHLGLTHLTVGYDFALGRGREGNALRLRQIGRTLGYSLQVAPQVELEGELVSSSAVRAYLAAGQVEHAARLLGRDFHLDGLVIPGDGRGRTIGIPTANLEVWPSRALPRAGVYICRASVDGVAWGAVTNIGVRPTFEDQPVSPRVETHLLDYSADLYGQTVALEFVARLRDEQRFPDAAALVAQIHADIVIARQRLQVPSGRT